GCNFINSSPMSSRGPFVLFNDLPSHQRPTRPEGLLSCLATNVSKPIICIAFRKGKIQKLHNQEAGPPQILGKNSGSIFGISSNFSLNYAFYNNFKKF